MRCRLVLHRWGRDGDHGASWLVRRLAATLLVAGLVPAFVPIGAKAVPMFDLSASLEFDLSRFDGDLSTTPLTFEFTETIGPVNPPSSGNTRDRKSVV